MYLCLVSFQSSHVDNDKDWNTCGILIQVLDLLVEAENFYFIKDI